MEGVTDGENEGDDCDEDDIILIIALTAARNRANFGFLHAENWFVNRYRVIPFEFIQHP